MKNRTLALSKTFLILSIAFLIISITLFEISSSTKTFAIFNKKEKTKSDVYDMLQLFGKAFEIARDRYVDEVDDKKLIEGAIDGMLSKLDPHSGFLNTEDFTEMTEQTSGSFGGLGIEVTMEKGIVKVISPLDDSPAAKAGVKAGDLITHIDEVQVYGLTLTEAVKKMKGSPGTKVKLKIFRDKLEPLNITVVRDVIRTEPVKFKIRGNNDVGYLRLSTFNDNSYEDMLKVVKKSFSSYPKIKGFILDLRNNTGGLLDQAVKVSDAFLNQGEIVSIMSRQKDSSRVFFAEEGDIINNMPLVVLINGASASAAEIVAGALQDHRRALILGTKSYGKGSVQTLIPIENTALKITTARYYTPSGRSIQADGIEPDIVINRAKIEEEKDERLFTESTLTNALKKENNNLLIQDIKTEKEKLEKEFELKDYQLNRAIDLVRAISIYKEGVKVSFEKIKNKNSVTNKKDNTSPLLKKKNSKEKIEK